MNKEIISTSINKDFESIKKIDKNFHQIFAEWVQSTTTIDFKLTHSTESVVNILMQQIPINQRA